MRHRLAAIAYGLFVPALWLAVGSGYVDIALTAFGLAGAAFGAGFLRRRHWQLAFLSMLAFALAAGVKLTAMAGLVLAPAIMLAASAREREARRATLAAVTLGGVVAAAIVGPPILQNWIRLGHPFEVPLELAGWRLGPENPALSWYMSQALDRPAGWVQEGRALAVLFDWPTKSHPHLSALSAAVLALALLGCLRCLRLDRQRAGALLFALVPGAVALAGFYHSSFSVVRGLFAESNGRFLLPLVISAPLLATLALAPARAAARCLRGGPGDGSADPRSALPAARPVAGRSRPRDRVRDALRARWPVGGRRRRIGRHAGGAGGVRRGRGAALGRALARPRLGAALSAAQGEQRASPDQQVLAAGRPGARRRRSDRAPHRGHLRKLRHGRQLALVSPPRATPAEHAPLRADLSKRRLGALRQGETRFAQGDFAAWARRLHAAGITDVVAFEPASVELEWMLGHPEVFSPIEMEPERWGAFALGRDRLAALVEAAGRRSEGTPPAAGGAPRHQHAMRP